MIKNNHPETVVPQFAKPRVHKASEHALVRLHTLHPLHAFAARSSVAACADRTPTMTAVIAPTMTAVAVVQLFTSTIHGWQNIHWSVAYAIATSLTGAAAACASRVNARESYRRMR